MSSRVLEYSKTGAAGVSKNVKTEGDGAKPIMGAYVRVKYSGYHDDGRVVTESGNKVVRLGMRELWGTGADLGLFDMKPGERALILLEHEFSGIDGGGKLNLDVTLLEILDTSDVSSRDCRRILVFVGLFVLLVGIVHYKLHLV